MFRVCEKRCSLGGGGNGMRSAGWMVAVVSLLWAGTAEAALTFGVVSPGVKVKPSSWKPSSAYLRLRPSQSVYCHSGQQTPSWSE